MKSDTFRAQAQLAKKKKRNEIARNLMRLCVASNCVTMAPLWFCEREMCVHNNHTMMKMFSFVWLRSILHTYSLSVFPLPRYTHIFYFLLSLDVRKKLRIFPDSVSWLWSSSFSFILYFSLSVVLTWET